MMRTLASPLTQAPSARRSSYWGLVVGLLTASCGAQTAVVGENEDAVQTGEPDPSSSSDTKQASDEDEQSTIEEPETSDPESDPVTAEEDEQNDVGDGQAGTESGDDAEDDEPSTRVPCSDATTMPLPGEEVAAILSRLILDAPPSEALLQAAADGKLDTYGEVECKALDLVSKTTVKNGLLAFFRSWLEMEALSPHPEVSPEVWASMQSEADEYLGRLAGSDAPNLTNLLQGSTSEVDVVLAEHYGVSLEDGLERDLTEVPHREGFLTLGLLTASLRRISGRGVWLMDHFQCQPIPPPPSDTPRFEPITGSTFRESYVENVSAPACQGCHSLFDSLGFGFEHFDDLGRPRDMENGQPIDVSGALSDTDEAEWQQYETLGEFMALLADSPRVSACIAQQALAFAVDDSEADAESLGPENVEFIQQAFVDSGRDFRQLLVAVTQVRELWERKAP